MTVDTGQTAPSSHPGWFAIALLFATGTLWGMVIVVAKFAIDAGIPPFGYGMWALFFAGLAILLTVCAPRRKLPPLKPEFLKFYLITGFIRVAAPNAILYVVLRHIPAGIMAVLLVLSPAFTYAMALIAGIEKFVLVRFFGLATGFAGALLIVLPKSSLPHPDMLLWALLGFGTPFFYALGALIVDKRRPAGSDSMALASSTLLSGSFLLLPAALIFGEFHVLWPPFELAEAAIAAHAVLSALCFMGQFELIRRAGAVFSSQLSFLISLSGVMWGMLLLGERHSLWVWGALVLIFAGVWLVTRRPDARQ